MSAPAQDSDTIAAIATAPGEAGIAVIRISGPAALAVADAVFTGTVRPSAAPARTVLYGSVHGAGADANPLDEVILLVFRAPHSYTREDVVEIQGHGGRVSARRVLRAVLTAGARMAEPGEFTRRAFLNGRLDLAQCEAVADLIRAQSERAASLAVEQLDGSLSDSIATIYDDTLACVADLEATMDFAEEELPASVLTGIAIRVRDCRAKVAALIGTWREGHLLREGVRVVISGEPNVGKSTLMNGLLGTARSIVTDVPGTTRDTIEEQLLLDGIPLRVVDTAGLREADCPVEQEGIRRAESAMQAADVHLHVLDGSRAITARDLQRIAGLDPQRTLVVLNKADLGLQADPAQIPGPAHCVTVSLLQPEAIPTVQAALLALLDVQITAGPHAAIAERHHAILRAVQSELDQALVVLSRSDLDGHLLAAEHLRTGLAALGTITGRECSEDLLDSIFSRFCIGK